MADHPVLHFLILGHSFITRSDKHLSQTSSDNHLHNFTLPRVSHDVNMQGRSGAHAGDMFPLFQTCFSYPDVVIIDVGTNDLTDGRLPVHTLALPIFNIARRLTRFAGVKRVVLMEILPRTTWGRHGAPVSFSRRVTQYNTMLKSLIFQYKDQVPVTFWFHKGMASNIENFISDGVHLNSLGMIKYIKSVRRAILKTSRIIRRPT